MRIIYPVAKTFDAGFGLVSIDKPSPMHLGRKLWNCSFRFTAPDGREYWGTVFRVPLAATLDVELRTHGKDGFGRALPAAHKVKWRETIAAHAGPVIAAAREEARRCGG